MGAASLAEFLVIARAEIDDALERWLPKPPDSPQIIAEAMRYSVFAGGKRLRPALTLAAADAVARHAAGARAGVVPPFPPPLADDSGELRRGAPKRDEREGGRPAASPVSHALPAACAIELIHTYSLIHDDLPAMDNDTLRRGRPTLHVVYGEGIAILAGDGLHAAAFTLIAREPAADDPAIVARKLRVIAVVGEAAGPDGMVGGQAIDLQAAGQAPGHAVALDAEGLRAMHARKTGALIRASAVSGAIMAGAADDLVEAIDRYAADIGLAFQIVDDILDIEGDPASLGKTAGKDAAGAKPTYPALFGVERSRALATECLERAHRRLDEAGLTDGWLGQIADYVVSRKH